MSKLQFLLNELAPYLQVQQPSKTFSSNVKSSGMLFAVHGTQSGPDTWRGSRNVLEATARYFGFDSSTTIDASFNWGLNEDGRPVGGGDYRLDWLKNGEKSRREAAKLLYKHIVSGYERKYPGVVDYIKNRQWTALRQTLEQNPLILVAHSHGGNVCMQLLSLFQQFGIKVYLCTIATPVYENGEEDPNRYQKNIIEHAHYWASSDMVQGELAGKERYQNNFSRNHYIPTTAGHSFQHRDNSPGLLADCIDFYAKHKSLSILPIEFQSQLKRKYPGMVLPCLLYTSPSPRDKRQSRMPSSA